MTKKKRPKATSRGRTGVLELRNRLQVAEDTLRAIQVGEVDALVVTKARGQHVITLAGAELPYKVMFDQMYEGAVTLTPDGIIAYCNRRFAEIVRRPLIGRRSRHCVTKRPLTGWGASSTSVPETAPRCPSRSRLRRCSWRGRPIRSA
jgi:PAS domain-containing protein